VGLDDPLLAILDDSTKICHVAALGKKSEAFGEHKLFINQLETQVGEQVRFVRSDGAEEFKSMAAKELSD
jgi:hypothetical protein